jgi:hypothetical protein
MCLAGQGEGQSHHIYYTFENIILIAFRELSHIYGIRRHNVFSARARTLHEITFKKTVVIDRFLMKNMLKIAIYASFS